MDVLVGWSIPSISIKRPVSAAMFFLALSLLGLFSWYRIPVQLLPATTGETLFVEYGQMNSDPEVVERELLIPLETRLKTIAGVVKTSGEIIGSQGNLKIEFAPGSNIRIRELEVRRIAADLVRDQPRGTYANVFSQDTTALSQFAMSMHVLGNDDKNALRDFVERHLKIHIESVPGVGRVAIFGGSSREVTISLDTERALELGITTAEVMASVSRFRTGEQFLGSIEEFNTNIPVVIENSPESIEALKKVRIKSDSPITLGHVAQIELGAADEQTISRVNGRPSVTLLVFQDQGANLIELGQKIRARVESLQEEMKPFNVELLISFDSSDTVEKNLDRLKWLAGIGFLVALVVLFLFLKNLRAVLVVAIALPVSILIAGAMLYLGGYSLNLITLFGLVVGTGMLVDNSIVVYEAVLRNIERGFSTEKAAVAGVQRTIRAILTASATNAVVFLPLIFIDEIPLTVRQLFENVVPAILFPLTASVIVAVGLVPLLTRRFSANAARDAIERKAKSRELHSGQQLPNLPREMFAALLKTVLRKPAPWGLGITFSIILTLLVALPWVLVQSGNQSRAEATQVRYKLEFIGGETLEFADSVFQGIERQLLPLEGLKSVESSFDEENGVLTVFLRPKEQRPKDTDAGRIRSLIENAVADMPKVRAEHLLNNDLDNAGSNAGDDFHIAISGPTMERLLQIGNDVISEIEALPQIEKAQLSSREALEELVIKMDPQAAKAFGIYWLEVVDPLRLLNRNGTRLPFEFLLHDGREIPVVIRRAEMIDNNVPQHINDFQTLTPKATLTLDELLLIERRLPPPAISHFNGNRELRISYQIKDGAAKTGASKVAFEHKIAEIIQATQVPEGYSVQSLGQSDSTDWFQVLALPVLFLLYAVLAIAFESFTMPILVLFAVPLTILGAVWGLFLAGLPLDAMAFVGVVVLLGLTINPAILLVDRMQQRLLSSSCSGGTAAMAAVRERVRPVLMTSSTSIAALWPMALTHGNELEMWPSFATVIIGGLVTSTLLTLIVIPVGFMLLARLDKVFRTIGVWSVMLWLIITGAVVTPLLTFGVFDALVWQMFATVVIAVLVLLFVTRFLIKEDTAENHTSFEQGSLEVRYLSKIYGQSAILVKAFKNWRKVSEAGVGVDSEKLKINLASYLFIGAAMVYMAANVQTLFWTVVFSYAAGFFISHFLIVLMVYGSGIFSRRHQSEDETVANHSGGKESLIWLTFPWAVLATLVLFKMLLPTLNHEPLAMPTTILLLLASVNLILQLAKRSAKGQNARQQIPKQQIEEQQTDKDSESESKPGKWKTLWQGFSGILFPFHSDDKEVTALSSVHFKVEKGMIGILGPNGAGKSTLFRLLTSSITPSIGTIYYGKREIRFLHNTLAKILGYLPQSFGFPKHLTPREYLDYFALSHGIHDPVERNKRVEIGLENAELVADQNNAIGSMSGGMQQRLAIARMLLHEPSVIIVDEPTVGIDPIKRIRLRNQLSQLAKTRTVLFSTHVVEDVAVACDRVLVVNKGQIIFDGTTQELAMKATGKVWHITLKSNEVEAAKQNVRVLAQTNTAEGMVKLRVLSNSRPHESAEQEEAELEDGYMQILYGEPD